MASLVIGCAGTWGDVLPFLALGQRLRERGHAVTMAANPLHHALIERCGLETRPLGGPIQVHEALKPPPAIPGWRPDVVAFQEARLRYGDRSGQDRDLLEACRGADALIAHANLYAAHRLRARLGLPWISISLRPSQFNHYYHGPAYSPLPAATLNLLASSDYFSEPNLQYMREGLRQTGFFFFAGSPAGGPTEDALRTFLDADGKPLVLCLGCLPGPDAARIAALAVQAAEALRLRLVVQPGWEALSRESMGAADSQNVFVAGPSPHDELFSRAAAVIHSGSIGLCARAMRCGTPMLLLPRSANQLFNALCITTLKAGAAISPSQVSVESMAEMVTERVLTADCRKRAEHLREDLRGENGLDRACALIEHAL